MENLKKFLSWTVNLTVIVISLAIVEGKSVKNQFDNQRDLTSGVLSITLGENEKNFPSLEISCPIGVTCDENYVYRAYDYSDQDVALYLSFNPKIVGNYSLKSFKENFNYINFWLYFPENYKLKAQNFIFRI